MPVAVGGAVVMPSDAVLCDGSGVLDPAANEAEQEARTAIGRQASGLARQRQVAAGAKLADMNGATAKVLAGI